MRTKVLGVIVAVLAFITQVAGAQGVAEVKPDQQVFNFGTIEEAKGLASHVFKIENTGTAPSHLLSTIPIPICWKLSKRMHTLWISLKKQFNPPA